MRAWRAVRRRCLSRLAVSSDAPIGSIAYHQSDVVRHALTRKKGGRYEP